MADELRTPLTGNTGSSFMKACFNGTNAFLGIGLLTVPYALSSGGWLSLVLFFLIAIMTFYTGILLKRCMEADPSIRTYLDIAGRAFGTRGRIIVSIIMNSELYLVAIGLLILEGDNLHKLFPKFMVKLGTLTVDGRQSFVIITALVIFPSMLLTDLSILSYVSATGVFSCLIILGSILCVGAIDGVGFHAKGSLLNLSGIPTAVSLYIVCFAGHPVIPSIYTSMRHRYQFSKVLLFSFLLTTITYMSMAIVAYLIYALMVTPVATAIEGGLSEDYKNWRPIRLLIRITLLISTVFVAYVFPYYESLMAIVGSIFVVLGSFLIPCMCYLKIFYSYRNWSYELMGKVGIILFGTLAGVLGTYSSIAELV
ncbi:hypothetical protein L1049_022526 [Liquidambar formosana]|uniref:Amino acid transporter transmembrane domain-containing protein n=1 Tax=Liquidambar formosana TaxID=63359 RepID=A0AAP0RD39_LIQFO